MPKQIPLLDFRMHDGSRHFLSLPESVPWSTFRDDINAFDGAKVTGFITDEVTEVWIDFTFRGQEFTINNQFCEYWFFVKDVECPDEILHAIANYCRAKLGII